MQTARDDDGSESEWEDSADDEEWSDGSSAADADDGAAETAVDGDFDGDNEPPPCCFRECLQAQAAKYAVLNPTVRAMSKSERVTTILTIMNMSVLFAAGAPPPSNAVDGGRDRFVYYAPVIGPVCKAAFQRVFGISHRTFTLYRKRALAGNAHAKPHGNIGNQHAKQIDEESVADWLREVGVLQGEVAGVRVRRVNKSDGVVRLVPRAETFTLLPATYTWDFLYNEFKRFLSDEFPDEKACSRRAFGCIAQTHCPDLRIRAPRDNVCDICCILRSRMPRGVTVEESEAFSRHVADARGMRFLYKEDCGAADDDHLVLTTNFSQNLTLPNVPETPSMWYFMTLMSVRMFGAFCHNTDKQYNFLYSEKRAGKGSNEVISMIHRTLQLEGVITDTLPQKPRRLTVWADNCGGQNKNSYLVAYLRLLVDVGVVREANLNFLIKGHTKNACDRGFGHVKRHILRNEAWILADLVELVNGASGEGEAVCLEDDRHIFANFKPFFETLYTKLKGIQKYQLFRMPPENFRGIVECRTTPTPSSTKADLKLKTANFAFLLSMPLPAIWKKLLEPTALPAVNAEKASDFHKKISPYVPTKYKQHPFYKKPSDEIQSRAKAVKDQRAQLRAGRVREIPADQSTTTASNTTRKRRRTVTAATEGAAEDRQAEYDDEGKEEVV